MSHTVKLTDGTTKHTASLIYDAASQTDYQMRFAEQRRQLGRRGIWHTPDFSESGPEPIGFNTENRLWYLTLTVYSDSRDDQLNNLNALSRILRSAGDARAGVPLDGYYIEIQLDSATNWTRYDCKNAYIADESGLYGVLSMSPGHAAAPKANPIIVAVETEPTGYGDIETLRNYCKTPHFLEDTNSDGLADNWTEIGTPTTTLDTSVYYVGGQSQKVVTDASGNDGIESDTMAAGASQPVIASVAIRLESGSPVAMTLYGDVSGVLVSVDTDDEPDEQRVGDDGNVWSIYYLRDTTGAGDSTVKIQVYRLYTGPSAATFYVDRVYCDITADADTDPLPVAWSSYKIFTNHYDDDEAHIDYIDVCDIPGDSPADTRLVTAEQTWAATGNPQYWYIACYVNPTLPGRYVQQESGAGSGDRQYSSTSVDDTWTAPASISTYYKKMKGDHVLLAVINDQDTTPGQLKARIYYGTNAPQYFETEALTIADNQQWCIEALGPINMEWPEIIADDDDGLLTSFVTLYAKHDANTANVYVDFLRLMPAGGSFCIAEVDPGYLINASIVFDGGIAENHDIWHVVGAASRTAVGPVTGSLPRFRTSCMNRLQFAVRELQSGGDTHETSIGSHGDMTIRYRPRTSTLLGTV